MKRALTAILSLFSVAQLWAAAPEKLTPENTKIRKVDQNVEVSFDVTVDKLKPNYKVVIAPVLYNGTNRQALDETVVAARRRSL